MTLEREDVETLAKALCKHVLALIETSDERREDLAARAQNWHRDGKRITYEEAAKHARPQADSYTIDIIDIIGDNDADDVAGTAPRTRYTLKLAESSPRGIHSRWLLIRGEQVVIRYRRPPTLAHAYDDAMRCHAGEFDMLSRRALLAIVEDSARYHVVIPKSVVIHDDRPGDVLRSKTNTILVDAAKISDGRLVGDLRLEHCGTCDYVVDVDLNEIFDFCFVCSMMRGTR